LSFEAKVHHLIILAKCNNTKKTVPAPFLAGSKKKKEKKVRKKCTTTDGPDATLHLL